MEKSANKRWKESGSTLSFKEWIERENRKNEPEEVNFLPFVGDTIRQASPIKVDTSIIEKTIQEATDDLVKTSGYKTISDEKSSTIFGLDKNILLFSTILIAGSVGFYFYSKYKKK
jgi:hypothetical protein